MSIGNRLLLGFGAIIVLMIVLGAFGLSQIAIVKDNIQRVVERDFALATELNALSDGQVVAASATQEALRIGLTQPGATAALDQTESDYQRGVAETNAAMTKALRLSGEFAADALSDERAQLWRRSNELLVQANALISSMGETREQQFRMVRAGQIEVAMALQENVAAKRDQFLSLIAQMRGTMTEGVLAGQRRTEQVFEQSQISVLAVVGGAVVVALLVTFLIRRSIVNPVQSFARFVERVGKGDLAGERAAAGRDEVGRLGSTLNGMVVGLRELAVQTRDATSNLSASITEIRASTQEQAASVEEQLAAVQETAATVDEINHAGGQVNKRAQEAIASAQLVARNATDGFKAVEETHRVMDLIREQAEAVAQNILALSEKTQAIGDIISIVNDISERSHLLALNAAIEAAAVGENGRSFAIVASEMKVLADQAKEATNQVRGILGDVQRGINTSVMLTEEAVKRVAAGKDKTEVTQRTIGEMTGRFQDSVLTFQQIVASTNQQQIGIEQVTGALQNIRQASQQTAAGTRQLNDAAAALTDLAQQLLGLSNRYRL